MNKQVIEIEAGKDVILTINGEPVIYLHAKEVGTRKAFGGDNIHPHYDFCASGITLQPNPDLWFRENRSSCSVTASLEIKELSPLGIETALLEQELAYAKRELDRKQKSIDYLKSHPAVTA